VLEIHALADSLFDQDFLRMQVQRAAGARLAPLKHGLRAVREIVQRREPDTDHGKIYRLFHAAEISKLAIAPPQKSPVGWRAMLGPKVHRRAHNARPFKKLCQPCGRNVDRFKPAQRGLGRKGRERSVFLGFLHDKAPWLLWPDPILGNVFLCLVVAHPDMTAGCSTVIVQRKGEDRLCARAFDVEKRRGTAAEIGPPGFVPPLGQP